MKLAVLLFCFFSCGLFLLNCQKKFVCPDCEIKINKPPVANAGIDQKITLPKDSVVLDGSSSSDPDGKIVSYKWIKVSGPVSYAIINIDSSKTIVKSLVMGVYKFELAVTDNGGLSAKDTVQVIVDSLPTSNHPPVANAGVDQTITLPNNYVTLDGRASTDPDNNITSYAWTKISGPSAFNIVNSTAVQTQVTNLVQGVYQFELKVTDAGGLFSKDTVQVTVNAAIVAYACGDTNRPHINAQLIPIGALSKARGGMAVASAGNKIVFAGDGSSRVDIYDFIANTWSTAELSAARSWIGAVGAGNKVFFAGGQDDNGFRLNVVDIYDVSTNAWTVSQLSRVADGADGLAAATVGDKVFFAGGNYGIYAMSTVDIYNLTTNTWSTASLSSPRNFITALSANNKVYFTGGDPWTGVCSKIIDIYDNTTSTWSTSTLQVPRGYHAAIAVNGVLYFAGGKSSPGFESICSVETININTGSRSLMNLSGPADWFIDNGENAVVKDNKIIFWSTDRVDTKKFDIYNIATNTWSIGVMPIKISGASIISVNNTIYVAGGSVNGVLSSQVWKLEF